jgi:hypothetical protein
MTPYQGANIALELASRQGCEGIRFIEYDDGLETWVKLKGTWVAIEAHFTPEQAEMFGIPFEELPKGPIRLPESIWLYAEVFTAAMKAAAQCGLLKTFHFEFAKKKFLEAEFNEGLSEKDWLPVLEVVQRHFGGTE